MGLLLGQTCAPALRIKRLRPGASLPAYQTTAAAGLDLAACLEAPISLAPGEIRVIPCGFCMSLPPGWEGQVRPRSGLASRFGVTLPNAPGTIDADYRGEVMVPLINHSAAAFTVEHGMRIAQLVIAPVAQARVCETDDLDAEEGTRAPLRGADLSRVSECRTFPPVPDAPSEAAALRPAAKAGGFLSGLATSAGAQAAQDAANSAPGSRTRGVGGFGSTGL